ncbi:phosphate ABC transporter permease PstA [Rubinisphaera sp. JC750]|uniref:phosphate ABC transporter permease PstA n=1 Tax=Rubinisphaera sp. JC750 TaxID=2898658 RepID=UPI001EFFB9E7|nr:phosphate ABC transporter permease PstA [Rubinisphaera sp. JC750]
MSDNATYQHRLRRRHMASRIFAGICLLSTWFGLFVLVVLLTGLTLKATGIWDPTGPDTQLETRNWLTMTFLTEHMSRKPEQSGMIAGVWGSLWLMLMTGFFSIPIGVGAAVYLEEYSKPNRFTRFIRLNIANLAGVPSIVFGILGLTVFSRMFGLFADGAVRGIPLGIGVLYIPLPFGKTLLSGSLTLSLLILPIVIIASQEALRSVPQSIRHAALALGATKWQTIWHQVLPASLPGIMTGVILALSRAIGETAPLIVIGAATYIRFNPGGMERVTDYFTTPQTLLSVPSSQFTAMPLQIYEWVSHQPNPEFKNVAAAAIVVLLAILLLMNGLAVYIRHHFSKRLDW